MSSRDEDIKAMLELQCLVIEDLLTKQMVFFKPEAPSISPDRSRQEDLNESKGKRNKLSMGRQQSLKK